MHRLTSLAWLYAVLLVLSATPPVVGQGSVYDQLLDSEPQARNPHSEDFAENEPLAANRSHVETFLAPTLDLTAARVVSTLPRKAWQADVELVAFRPEFGGIDFTEDGEDVYYVTPRITLGWESKSGYGIRGRLWGYEAETETQLLFYSPFYISAFTTPRDFAFRSIPPGNPFIETSPTEHTTGYSLRTGSLDADFYKRFVVDETSIILGAGLKSVAFQIEVPSLGENTNLGVGLGLFSDVRHLIYRTEQIELSLVGSGRVGFLSGEVRRELFTVYSISPTAGSSNDANLVVGTGSEPITFVEEKDADMVISEASLGLEWQRNLGWSVLTLRAQYETQLWNTDVSDDLTFNGGAVKAGLAW